MSKECIAGLVTVQQTADRFGIAKMDPVMVLEGCVAHFETAALYNTLTSYDRRQRLAATNMIFRYLKYPEYLNVFFCTGAFCNWTKSPLTPPPLR
jgi:hypothetical protein